MRSTEHRLRTLLGGLAQAVLASGAVAACSSTIDRGDFDATYCTSGRYAPLEGLAPKVPVDYIESRAASASTPTVLDSSGQKCKTAKDPQACQSAVAAARSAATFTTGGQAAQTFFYVYTRGDEVGTVGDKAALVGLLAPIDTPTEAALIATLEGHQTLCPDDHVARRVGGGMEIVTRTGNGCPDDVRENRTFVSDAGLVEVRESTLYRKGDSSCTVGRRPAGLEVAGDLAADATPLGAWFASASELEAAAVHAFRTLARELEELGAPQDLVDRARSAARDEIRHARATAALAARFGGAPRRAEAARARARSILEIALENAVEGCVRETYGALVATYQAGRAADRSIARSMRAIARDETRHAALAWDVAALLEPRLSPDERARVDEARRAAIAELEDEALGVHAAEVVTEAGVPNEPAARRLLAGARELVWARAA